LNETHDPAFVFSFNLDKGLFPSVDLSQIEALVILFMIG